MAYDILLSPRAMQRGYFLPQEVAGLLDAHCRGAANHAERLWDLLVLELWHHTFIDGTDFAAIPPTATLAQGMDNVLVPAP